MKVVRMSDRISIKIKTVTFVVSPMTSAQKSEVTACMDMVGGVQFEETFKALSLILKYSLKDIKGLKDIHNKEYKLSFDEDGVLTQECVDEIMNLNVGELSIAAFQLLNGIGDKIVDPSTGKELKGVKISYGENSVKK